MSRVERQKDGYFVFVQEEVCEAGPFERWDPRMRGRWEMEGRVQLGNLASDSEGEESRRREGSGEEDGGKKQRRAERRLKKRQRHMPFGTFVRDFVGGGRVFVRDI